MIPLSWYRYLLIIAIFSSTVNQKINGVTGLSQSRETKTFLSYAFVCGQIHKLRKVKMECSSGTIVNLNNVCARFPRSPVYASMSSVINQFGDQSLHLCNFSATK